MKKVFSVLILVSMGVFGEDLQISQSESVSYALIPNEMVTSFGFTKEDKNVNTILKSFEALNTQIKAFSKDNADIKCEGGSNNIYPQYQYSNNKSIFVGYQGSVNFSCRFKEVKTYNALMNISFLTNEKISLSPIQWVVADSETEKHKALQKLTLASKAMDVANSYSKHLQKTCKLQNIDFTNHVARPNYDYQPRMMAMAMDNAAIASQNYEPIKKEMQLQTDAVIRFTCK